MDDSTTLDRPLAGRVALVIGAETQAGVAIARALSQAGAALGLAAMRADEGVLTARRLQRELREADAAATTYAMDVTLGQNVKVTTRQITKELGGMDVVVSAPDHPLRGPLRLLSELELAQVTAFNYYAHVYAARAAADEFRRRDGGRLLIVTRAPSEAPGGAAYAAAAAAARSLVPTLAAELGGEGVTVTGLLSTTVAPEVAPEADAAAADDPEAVARRALELVTADPASVQGRLFEVSDRAPAGARR